MAEGGSTVSVHRAALDALTAPVVVLAAVRDDEGRVTDFRVVHVNPAVHALLGADITSPVGRGLLDVWPQLRGSDRLDRLVAVADTGSPWMFRVQTPGPELRPDWVEGVASRIGGGPE